MIPQPPTPTANSEVTYQVMPQEGGKAPAVTSGPLPPVAPPPPLGGHPLPVDSGEPFFKSTKFYVTVAILAAVILAAGGWYLFGSNNSDNAPAAEVSKLPSVWLKQHFDKTACDDNSICGDEADPDSDGLTNYDEFKAGTTPVNPDTDQDGLADGDEVHVYKTDPSLKYTDRRPEVASNNWTDAVQIKNGYDPNIPAAKLSEARLKQIADDTAKYGLHEPTKTTMGAQSSAPTGGTPVAAQNCGTYESTHLIMDVNNPNSTTGAPTTTASEKIALKCMDTAIAACSPASLDSTTLGPDGSSVKANMKVLGKTGTNCGLQSSSAGETLTCQVPQTFMASLKTAVDQAPQKYEGGLTATVSLAIFLPAAFQENPELTNSITGEKIKISCS